MVDGEDDLVHVAMESRVGKCEQTWDGGYVVVSFGWKGRLAGAVVHFVIPLEDTSAAQMNPDNGIGSGAVFGAEDASDDGFS